MRTHPAHARARLSAVILLSLSMLLATFLVACSPTTQVPDPQTIINKVKQQNWKDATFTFTANAATPGASYTATGNGVVTRNPQRTDETITSNSGSQTQTEEVITDGQNVYARVKGQQKWVKLTTPPDLGGFGGVTPTTDFGSLQNLTFVGSETIEGYPTWHVKGTYTTTTTQGKTVTNNVDLWVRQDNYWVVQVKDHATVAGEPGTTSDATLLFTKWNTGAVITPPPPGQVATS